MFTVTYLPQENDGFILTSNRDESPMRKTIPPKKYVENGVELVYPKDQLAGGTWIGASTKNRLVCLLNGAFKKHVRNSYYKMSRGLVVKNILTVTDAVAYIRGFNFNDIEPFTIIMVDWNDGLDTYELVWDGFVKHFKKLEQKPKIWSSSPLYDTQMKKERRAWFDEWLAQNNKYNQNKILEFHQDTDKGERQVSIKMKRLFVETVSITSVKKEKNLLEIQYFDVLDEQQETLIF